MQLKTPHSPYLPLAPHPEQDAIDGIRFCWYIKPQQMAGHLRQLSDSICLADFEHIFFVLEGGRFLYRYLCETQHYPRDERKHAIEYHRHPIDGSREIITPVPINLSGKILIIDDVWDTARTAKLIVDDLRRTSHPSTIAIAVVAAKQNVPEQLTLSGVDLYAAVCVDNLWLGGCGMDLGESGKSNAKFRSLGGLVVKL